MKHDDDCPVQTIHRKHLRRNIIFNVVRESEAKYKGFLHRNIQATNIRHNTAKQQTSTSKATTDYTEKSPIITSQAKYVKDDSRLR